MLNNSGPKIDPWGTPKRGLSMSYNDLSFQFFVSD